MAIKSLKYKNISISYSVQGKGVAVVLLHGFLENKSMWEAIAESISKNHQVVSIDLLGHGKTGCLGNMHTMENQAKMVWFVLNTININTFVVIGHSMGGYIALAFAELFPKRITKLCLMNSTAAPDDSEKLTNRDRAIKVIKTNQEAFIRMAIPNLFSEKSKSKFKSEIELITQDALKMSAQEIIASIQGMKIRKDRTFLLKTLKIPILFIIGKKDPALNYNSLIDQIKQYPVVVKEFPDGHMSHIENKQNLIKTLLNFIQ